MLTRCRPPDLFTAYGAMTDNALTQAISSWARHLEKIRRAPRSFRPSRGAGTASGRHQAGARLPGPGFCRRVLSDQPCSADLFRQAAPRVRILRHEGAQVERHVGLRVLGRQLLCGGAKLFRIRFCDVLLADETVFVSDAETVEERPHHRS